MRWIMLAFSAVGNTEACVTRRRMSRPDIGFATTPTTPSPTATHLQALLCAPIGETGIPAVTSCSSTDAAQRAGLLRQLVTSRFVVWPGQVRGQGTGHSGGRRPLARRSRQRAAGGTAAPRNAPAPN